MACFGPVTGRAIWGTGDDEEGGEENMTSKVNAAEFHERARAGQTEGVAVLKQFVSKPSASEEKRTATFTITTGAVDRDNDTIAPDGWEVANYLKNGVVLWGHDYGSLPIGKALNVTPSGDGLKSTVQFPPKGVHPFADTVFELVKGGFLSATSVGFRPIEWTINEERSGGVDFKKQELLEWSIVPVPANPEALIAAEAAGIHTSLLKEWAQGVLETASWRGGDAAVLVLDDPDEPWREKFAATIREAATEGIERGLYGRRRRHEAEPAIEVLDWPGPRSHCAPTRQPERYDVDCNHLARMISTAIRVHVAAAVARETRLALKRLRGQVIDPEDYR